MKNKRQFEDILFFSDKTYVYVVGAPIIYNEYPYFMFLWRPRENLCTISRPMQAFNQTH